MRVESCEPQPLGRASWRWRSDRGGQDVSGRWGRHVRGRRVRRAGTPPAPVRTRAT